MCEYTQKPRAEQIYLHPLFGDIRSEATDARGLYGANMFAAVQASSNCECRKALISPNGIRQGDSVCSAEA